MVTPNSLSDHKVTKCHHCHSSGDYIKSNGSLVSTESDSMHIHILEIPHVTSSNSACNVISIPSPRGHSPQKEGMP